MHEQQAGPAEGCAPCAKAGTLGIFQAIQFRSLLSCELEDNISIMALTLISKSMAEPTLIAGVSASLGVIFHLSILSREIDSASGSLLIAFFLFWAGLVIALLQHFGSTVLSAFLRASLACSCFLLALALCTLIHRVFFHRLRRFPGPFGAKISRFWTVRLIKSSDFKYHVELEKLHRTYGDFVRTGLTSQHPLSKGT